MKKQEIIFDGHQFVNGFEKMLKEMNLPNSDKVYWELLKGRPLPRGRFSEVMDVPIDKAHQIIQQYGEVNKEG